MPISPRILALAFCLVAAGCATTTVYKRPVPAHHPDAASVTANPAIAARMLSDYRGAKGLGPVRLDPRLVAMAQVQADAMAAGLTMSHDVGGSFPSRLEAAGVEGRAAENILITAYSQKDAMETWQDSPSHNKNLLMPSATRFGIAVAKTPGRGPETYWAMVVAADPPESMQQVATLSTGPLVRRSVPASQGASGGSMLSAPFSGLFGR